MNASPLLRVLSPGVGREGWGGWRCLQVEERAHLPGSLHADLRHSSTCPLQRVRWNQECVSTTDFRLAASGCDFSGLPNLRCSEACGIEGKGSYMRMGPYFPLSCFPQTPALRILSRRSRPVSPGEQSSFGILCSRSEVHSPRLPPFAIRSDLGMSANTQHREAL